MNETTNGESNTNTFAPLKPRQRVFVEALVTTGVTGTTISRSDMDAARDVLGLLWPPAWIVKDFARRASRGRYDVPEIAQAIEDAVEDVASDAAEFGTTEDVEVVEEVLITTEDQGVDEVLVTA